MLGFLGDSVGSLAVLDVKPKLESVVNLILDVPNEPKEEWLDKIKDQSKVLAAQIVERTPKDIDVHIDYEEIKNMPLNEPLRILTWLILWLARYNVKLNFVSDLSIIFSKIVKVLSDKTSGDSRSRQ